MTLDLDFFPPKQLQSSLRRVIMHWNSNKEGAEWMTVVGFTAYHLPGEYSSQISLKSNPRIGQITSWAYSGPKPLSFSRQSESGLTCLKLFSHYCTSCFSNWSANEFPLLLLVFSRSVRMAVLLPRLIPVLILHWNKHKLALFWGNRHTLAYILYHRAQNNKWLLTNAQWWNKRLGSFIW